MRYVALLAAFVVLVSVAAGATVAAADQPAGALPHDDRFSPASPGDSPAAALHSGVSYGQLASAVGAPRTNFTVSLREDGSAQWTVETRIPLDDEPERDAFREYASAYESGATDGGPTVVPFRNAAVKASETTDREMSIEQANRTATLANDSGVLRLRFTWIGFLEPGEDGVLALGDAFETPNNGTWFGSLSASQRLVIEPPPGYEVSDVSQGFSYSISDRRIVAEGSQTFAAGDISIRYEPDETAPPPFPYPIAGAVVVLLFIVALVAYRRGGVSAAVGGDRGTATPENGDAAADDAGRSEAGVDADSGPNGSTPDSVGPTSGPSNGRSVDGDAGGTAADSAVDATDTGVGAAEANESEPNTDEDLELLSDEERVERLLGSHGGRMRQGTIVSETGWSDAKVSQLLSVMADEGRVEKLRLGRENLISLADDDGTDPDDPGP
jgi:type II secretory pathway pseudopilin PulG